MLYNTFLKFINEVAQECGDVPISITVPGRVYNKLLMELVGRRAFLPTHQRVEQDKKSSELAFNWGKRIINIIPETRVEDYIESKMDKLISGEICT